MSKAKGGRGGKKNGDGKEYMDEGMGKHCKEECEKEGKRSVGTAQQF